MPQNYLRILNQPLTVNEEEVLKCSEEKNVPFGDDSWIDKTVRKYDIEQVLRGAGRP